MNPNIYRYASDHPEPAQMTAGMFWPRRARDTSAQPRRNSLAKQASASIGAVKPSQLASAQPPAA